jgi:hypothetical protein
VGLQLDTVAPSESEADLPFDMQQVVTTESRAKTAALSVPVLDAGNLSPEDVVNGARSDGYAVSRDSGTAFVVSVSVPPAPFSCASMRRSCSVEIGLLM